MIGWREVYIIVTDKFYSSPTLFRALVAKGFGACGTAWKNRKGIPPSIGKAYLQRGEVVSSVDNGILSLKWRDKKDVLILSTKHGHQVSVIQKGRWWSRRHQ